MNKSIVVGSYRNSPWIANCLNSIPQDLPVLVVRNSGYECGALRYVMEHTNLDEFLFLQDSTRIKNPAWLYELMNSQGVSISLNHDPGFFGSFLGLWRREPLSKCKIPETPDKMSAVLAEMSLPKQYLKHEKNTRTLWPELNLDYAIHEEHFGRKVVVYENEHFWKAKGCWNGDMVTPCCNRDKSLREQAA